MSEPVGDLAQLRTAFLYQLRFYVRTWRFLGILVFVLIISAVMLALDVYEGVQALKVASPTAADFLRGHLAAITDVQIIAAAFLGGDAIAMDFGAGTGYLMLTLPLRRRTLLAGRFAAAAVATTALGLVYFGLAAAGALAFYGALPGAMAISVGLAALFGAATLAVAFFFSSFFRSSAVSMIVTVLLLILGVPILSSIGEFTGVEPWFSLDYAAGAITQVFSSSVAHLSVQKIEAGQGVSLTLWMWSPYLWEAVVILAAYLLTFLALAYVIYRSKELKG